jgi:uncharacterized protein (TIGR01777 family)
MPVPAEFLYRWHASPRAFERLIPPWERIEVIQPPTGLCDGDRVLVRVRLAGPISMPWEARMQCIRPGESFEDVQVRGPFAAWKHTHTMTPDGAAGCLLTDHVEYELPLGMLGRLVGGRFARNKLARMFAYRHRLTRDEVAAHYRVQTRIPGGRPPMKVLISGRSGLIGTELSDFLTSGGHATAALTRKASGRADQIHWSIDDGTIDRPAIEAGGFDAIVHLAGESIQGRWTRAKKRRIRDSRADGTRLLCETLAEMDSPPKTFICASGVNYYGDRGDEELTEESSSGDSFLADVCRQWEAACEPAREKGIRVVNLRTGVVLTPKGGALSKLLPPFKLGGGGKVGSGKQWWSWIAIDDHLGTIHHCLTNESLRGPVNATAPNPATNAEFTKTLGKVLSRPTLLPLPAAVVKLAFGQMGEELLLDSARVLPAKLLASGYQFRYPMLEPALRHLLGR